MEVQSLDGRKIFVIRQFLTAEECRHFIDMGERLGFSDAPVTTALGPVMRKDYRDNARVMLDDAALAQTWYERARDLLVDDWMGWQPCGLNERFRFYRYDVGQRFERHTDGYFERPTGERSQFTFMVYLNDGFTGGETAFYQGRHKLLVTPEAGTALVFQHRAIHEGCPVEAGRKYVLRTDVMYHQ
ncbi:MAG: 2OG-Fe(II) oxygenase [Gemmataceae bacterium]